MNRPSLLLSALVVLSLFSCDVLGPGGGGGGGETSEFAKGYLFVRKDDRNVYAADQSDLNSVIKLTTEGGARQPSLSKDGKKVVFVRTVGAETEIASVPVTGGTASRVIAGTGVSATAKNLRTPVWSPDGTRIVFAFDEGASSSLGLVNADGSGYAKLVGGGALSYSSPSFNAAGTSVLAAAGSSNTQLTQLETVAIADGSSMPVTNDFGNEAVGGVANRVVLSPDGTKAAFDARVSSGSTRIFVITLSSKMVTQLTDYPGDTGAIDSFPAWSGTKVTFSSDTGGNDNVYALESTLVKQSGGLQLPSAIEPWFGPN